MNIIRKWERFLGVGCSHGYLIDPVAEKNVLEFARIWKPVRVFHLGDFCDTPALRAGAHGTADEAIDIDVDIEQGLGFLEKLGVTDCTMGNHDERPWRFVDSPNAKERALAKRLVSAIDDEMKRLKIRWRNTWDVRSWISAYGYKWMHGYMFSENMARDHAEAHGNCVVAHAHTTALQKGRRDDNPTGICLGTLSNIPKMKYAKNRRKTLSWSQGLVWGEGYQDRMGFISLYENGQNGPWRLPI